MDQSTLLKILFAGIFGILCLVMFLDGLRNYLYLRRMKKMEDGRELEEEVRKSKELKSLLQECLCPQEKKWIKEAEERKEKTK